jgi:uncharacterized protein YcfJ
MSDNSWGNPWKLTTIALILMMVTAVVTGLVVANWSGNHADRQVAPESTPPVPAAAGAPPPSSPAIADSPAASVPAVPASPAPRAAGASTPRHVSSVPTQASIDACNRSAAAQVSQQHDKTAEVVKDGAIGAIAGAALGAAGGAIAGGGKGAGKGAAIGGLVGAGGGSLYGLNENQKRDQYYREAYARCMHAHGYSG